MPKSFEYPLDHPIAQAVEPMRQASRDAAKDRTIAIHESLKAQVLAQPDLQILAPYPKSNIGRSAYLQKKAFRDTLSMLTNHVGPDRRTFDAPDLREWDNEAAQRDIDRAMEAAEASFVLYVYKLIHKVTDRRPGEAIKAASVSEWGSLWSYSYLRVEFADGLTQNWHTQMIVNVSPLGTVFNQWPTRLLK